MKPIIGVENLVYAIMTSEGVYSAPVAIAPAIKIGIKTKVNNVTLYGDNAAQETDSMVGEITVDIETTYLSLSTQAALLGHTFDPVLGGITCSSEDVAPYVAIGFKSKKTNGKYRYAWLYKGKFEEPSEDAETMEDKIKYQTSKISATFISRVDGEYKHKADEEEGNVSDTYLSAVYSATVDLVAPTYTTSPVDGASNSSKAADIVVTFNKAMGITTINSSTLFLVKDSDSSAVALTVTWDVDKKVATCAHAALAGTTLYNLVLTTGIKSKDAVSIAANKVISFTTIA